jgi:aspartyl-tRNA(Asn)/glutamyl-tRNA(Gln) amidotransferase subunit C
MKIDDSLIDKLSTLAKLQFNGKERVQIKEDMERMLDLFDKLEEIDTTGVEPLIHMTEETGRMREDEIKGMASQADALKNAPSKDTYYFKVPKVIG